MSMGIDRIGEYTASYVFALSMHENMIHKKAKPLRTNRREFFEQIYI